MIAESSLAERRAAEFTGPLWAAIMNVGGPRTALQRHLHVPGLFAVDWLKELPLPVGVNKLPGQEVTLVGHTGHEHFVDEPELQAAYASCPRTRIYEHLNLTYPDGWFAHVSKHLGTLAASELPVLCAVYESTSGDESLGRHFDTWLGANVALDGEKEWKIGYGLADGSTEPVETVITKPGDALIIPKYLPHDVTTPENPGYSTHLSFDICRDFD